MNKKIKLESENGITLIALIITIVILIIISAIALISIDNGIIEKIKSEIRNAEIAEVVEEFKLWQNSNILDGNNKSSIEILKEKYGDELEFCYNGNEECVKINGNLIPISEFGLNATPENGEWSYVQKICTPKLSEGMKAVYWDEDEIVQGDENFKIENWYNYKENIDNANDSKWANAVITDSNGNKSYFVWIPRYEYKINSDETIDINFISKETTTPTEGYKIHPAFQNGTENNFTNGEWDKELEGIWVAKYEMSRTDATISGVGSSTTFKCVSNVQSARSISIGNIYTYSQNFDKEIGNENLDSHLMKNSEWGAVAYLAHSKYGRNGVEIAVNASGSYITGSGTNLASTTGNITGIFDLSGGATEYLALYVSNGNSVLSNGSSFVKSEADEDGYLTLSTKYVTVYPYDESLYKALSDNNSSINNKKYGYGDAICETKGWNGDQAAFVSGGTPFLGRGGYFKSGSLAGIFSYANSRGNNNNLAGFRVVLAF